MRKSLTIVLLTALFVGCNDFSDLNRDPNNPSSAKTELLLTEAQKWIGYNQESNSGAVGNFMATLYVQYISETQYTDDSRYGTITFDFGPWYTGPLTDLQTIIDLNSDEATRTDVLSGGSNANQIAVARILQAFFFHHITDRWGMVPYTEALQGREALRPAYDDMSTIYSGMISTLEEAVSGMGGEPVTGDIIFGGDMAKWAQFANTLKMRIALRMADVNGSLARTEFEEAINAGVITEDVMFPFQAAAAAENPWFTRFRTRTDYALSETMTDFMKPKGDLRVLQYGDPAPNFDDGDGVREMNEIQGMPYGIENAGDITNAEISFPGQAIRAQDAPLPIFTMAEVHFAMAEAVERGWSVSGTAQAHYEAGIQASWEQWGVYGDGTDYAAYIAHPDVAYNSANWQQLIGEQKWVALFPYGYEAWAEWRRLGYPQLTPAPDPLNTTGEIPIRQAYPTSESELNSENYNSAVQSQGADGLDTSLWWDVN